MVFLLASCSLTQTIPSTSNLKLRDAYYENLIEKDLIITMNKELYEKVLIVKPIKMPGAMGYEFQVGKAICSKLQFTMTDLFRAVNLDTSPIATAGSEDYLVNVDLKDHKIKIGATIASEHIIRVVVEYTLYDSDENVLFTLLTDNIGTGMMSAKEVSGRTRGNMFDLIEAKGYRASIGRAYDEALIMSVDKFAARLIEHCEKAQ
jgi:hypothetical protein